MANFTVTFGVSSNEQLKIRQKLQALSDSKLADIGSFMSNNNSDMSDWFGEMIEREQERRA